MTFSPTELNAIGLRTAQEYIFNRYNKEIDAYAICMELLQSADLMAAVEAAAHCILATSGINNLWHARRGVEIFETLAREELYSSQMNMRLFKMAEAALSNAAIVESPSVQRDQGVVTVEMVLPEPYDAKLAREEEYVHEERKEEECAICHDLLECLALDPALQAGAQCILGPCNEKPVEHGKKAVEIYKELNKESPPEEVIKRLAKCAEANDILADVLRDEKQHQQTTLKHDYSNTACPLSRPESFYRKRLSIAQENMRRKKYEAGYKICDSLLLSPHIDPFHKAGAHVILATSTQNALWHARQAVELYERLASDKPKDGKIKVLFDMAGKILDDAQHEEETPTSAFGEGDIEARADSRIQK